MPKLLLVVHNLNTGQDIVHEFCESDFAFELVEVILMPRVTIVQLWYLMPEFEKFSLSVTFLNNYFATCVSFSIPFIVETFDKTAGEASLGATASQTSRGTGLSRVGGSKRSLERERSF